MTVQRLAEIGVLGYQMDIADGGDVDPATGRLLSIAELQLALRAIRQGPLTPPVGPSAPAPDAGGSVGTAGEPAPGAVRGDNRADYSDDRPPTAPGRFPDPDQFEGDPDSARTSRPRSARKQKRPALSAGDRNDRGEKPRPVVVRVARKVLGLDRGVTATDTDTDHPDADVPTAAAGPVGRRRRRRSVAAVVGDDFEVAPAPRGFAAVFWRWVARILLVVVLAAGVNQLFVKPFSGTAVVSVSADRMDPAAAAAVAAHYTADYLAYRPGRSGSGVPAVAAEMVAAANPAGQLFTGTGYVRADLVQPGLVTAVDAAHAVVSVTARIQLATPPGSATTSPGPVSTPAAPAAAAPAAAAADPGPVPAGWHDLGARWITVAVPVQTTPAGVRVSAGGGVFSGEPPMMVTPIGGGEQDNSLTTATRDVAAAFFTGYAASDVSYLAEPGVLLAGLSGGISYVSLTNWALSTPTAAATGDPPGPAVSGVGTGTVTWQLTGTDLRIAQQYALSMTSSQGRWYVAALSPATPIAQ